MAGRNRTERWMNDEEKALAREGKCVWQTGYGLPHTTYCGKKATHGHYCKEHWKDSLQEKYGRSPVVVFIGGRFGKVVRTMGVHDAVLDSKGIMVDATDIRFGKEARDLRGKLLGKRIV
jgi:hypothetical protein